MTACAEFKTEQRVCCGDCFQVRDDHSGDKCVYGPGTYREAYTLFDSDGVRLTTADINRMMDDQPKRRIW